MQKAEDIQSKLDALQEEMHAKVEACDVRYNKEKNVVFAARSKTIAELIAKKEVPADFWALALIHLLQAKDRESTTMPHFLGPYDEHMLRTYLEEIKVFYTDKGHRITLLFKPNPFFEETELWAEAVEVVEPAEEDDDDEGEPPAEERWTFSGVTWKEGHGPLAENSDEEDEEDDEEGEEGAVGTKRPHASGSSSDKPKTDGDSAAMHGPSVLEVFTDMPPHPEDDEELQEEDEDFILDAIDEWEAEMEDRKTLLRLMELYIHHNPVEAFQMVAEAADDVADGEAALKKTKAE